MLLTADTEHLLCVPLTNETLFIYAQHIVGTMLGNMGITTLQLIPQSGEEGTEQTPRMSKRRAAVWLRVNPEQPTCSHTHSKGLREKQNLEH